MTDIQEIFKAAKESERLGYLRGLREAAEIADGVMRDYDETLDRDSVDAATVVRNLILARIAEAEKEGE